jgi:hypothetical protein
MFAPHGTRDIPHARELQAAARQRGRNALSLREPAGLAETA